MFGMLEFNYIFEKPNLITNSQKFLTLQNKPPAVCGFYLYGNRVWRLPQILRGLFIVLHLNL